ncbi:hypothetical protein EI94DRAFT_1790287 [Lactarius quietus]|nr:hypothetical protein EI94DRAFT_1790287 [Lactarius quietus]
MSSEYASSGFKGSLVNPSINDIMPPRQRETYTLYSDYATKNYPPPGDTTSSGGRRTAPAAADSASGPVMIPQSQSPPRGREQHRDAESLDTRKEAADALAARYRASHRLVWVKSGITPSSFLWGKNPAWVAEMPIQASQQT